jgi:transposase
LGMDVSVNAIVVGVLHPGEEIPVVDRIFHDEESIRRLIGRFPDRCALSACYEAGRVVMSCIGCCPRWGWRVRLSRRR